MCIYCHQRHYNYKETATMPETGKQNGGSRATRSKKDKDKDQKNSDGNVEGGEGGSTFSKDDLDSLKQYMNLLHKNTENKFEESLAESNNESKKNFKSVEGKISEISTSMLEIKGNFKKLESKMETKLSSMQTTIDDLTHKLSKTQTELLKLRQQAEEDKLSFEGKIKVLQNDMSSIRESSQSEINGVMETLSGLIGEQEAHIERNGVDTKNLNEAMKMTIAKTQALVSANTSEINQIKKNVENLDNKMRSKNLVIEGINEKVNEDIVKEVFDCISPTIGDLKKGQIKSAYRMGKARGKKPRSIIVVLDDEALRDKILSKATDIKKQNNNKYLWLNRDQNDNSRRKRNLVKACFDLLKQNKHECTMKGSTIYFDGKQYGYDELSLLPDKCRPENAKSRLFDNDLSLAFHSEHVYCSNMYSAMFVYKGQLYTSAEQAYQVTKVSEAGYKKLAGDMLGFANPYYIKSVGGNTPTPEGWNDRSEGIMREIIRAKFRQNADLTDKLIQCPSTDFYEMTLDCRWGTGVRLPHVTKEINSKSFKGDNLVGRILRDIKNELVGAASLNTSTESNADQSLDEVDMSEAD